MLLDQRGRTYLFMLQTAGTYHTHSGTLAHDLLIGHPEGTRAETSGGHGRDGVPTSVRGLRAEDEARRAGHLPEGPGPDHDLRGHLPRGPRPRGGHRLGRDDDRAVPRGRRHGPDRVLRAARGAPRPGPAATWRGSSARSRRRSICASASSPTSARRGSDTTGVCWTCPPLGSPWRRSPRSSSRAACCAPICRPPSRSSNSCLRFRRKDSCHIETFEVLRRGWHVTDRSVRPDHRMVGHTGFLTIARRTA